MTFCAGLLQVPTAPRVPARRPNTIRPLDHLPLTPNPWRITACQAEVLRLIGEGMSHEGIAEQLGISRKTVDTHMANAVQRISAREGTDINRVRAAVLWDRFARAAAST